MDPRDASDSLADQVRAATRERRPLRIVGGDTKAWYGRAGPGERLDVATHRGVIDYDPSELVITARAGTPIQEIEAILQANGQCLGFEPPVLGPASTIGGVVAAGLAGPARPFAGGVRDHVLGVRVLDGRGRVLRFGGTVFKNVAGFDAFRLMCGAMGTLGVILDVSLRVTPRPRTCRTLAIAEDAASARDRLGRLAGRPLPLDGACHDGRRLHLRLSGPTAGVEAAARDLAGESEDPVFWRDLRDLRLAPMTAPRLWRLSLPATAVVEDVGDTIIDWAGAQRWIAADAPSDRMRAMARRAGGHATLFRGARPGEAVFEPLPDPLFALHKRLKAVFDPAGILNPGRLYEGL